MCIRSFSAHKIIMHVAQNGLSAILLLVSLGRYAVWTWYQRVGLIKTDLIISAVVVHTINLFVVYNKTVNLVRIYS